MAKVRIVDVAREAGVSLGTVSNALNHPEKVRPDTRRLIQEAIDRLGYTPNQSARMLAGGRNATIGLVLPRLNHGPSLQIANGAHTEARRHGFDLLIANADGDSALEKHYNRFFIGSQVSGVLINPVETSHWHPCPTLPVPVVHLGIHSAEPGLYVTADHRAQGRIVAAHLVAQGARRVCIIGHADNQSMQLRLEGALNTFAATPDIEVEVIDAGEGGVSGDGYTLGAQLMRRDEASRPDAVLGLSDVLAAGAIAGVMSLGLNVPDDVMVAGCGGNPLAWCGAVPLTTSAPTGYEVGRKGVQLLLEAIEQQRADEEARARLARGGTAGTWSAQSGRSAETLSHERAADPLTHWELVRPFLLARESTGGHATSIVPGAHTVPIPELNLGVYL